MVTTTFPEFLPLCNKGEIIQKFENGFGYNSEEAFNVRKAKFFIKNDNSGSHKYPIGLLIVMSVFTVYGL